jgi:hypothetical protein
MPAPQVTPPPPSAGGDVYASISNKSPAIDYTALAEQARQANPATPPVDYDALADQARQSAGPSTPPPTPSWLDRAQNLPYVGPAVGTAVGLGKSVMGTAQGLTKLVDSVPGVGPMIAKMPGHTPVLDSRPTSTSQTVGKVTGDIGQFFALPVGKLAEAAKVGQPLFDLAVRSALEAGNAAAVQSAQQGSTEGAGRTAAITGAVTGGTGAALGALRPVGNIAEHTLIKPVTRDINDGFQIANIWKNNLGGSLQETYDKARAKLNDLTGQLRTALGANPSPTVDIPGALARTEQTLRAGGVKTYSRATQKAIDDFQEELSYWAKNGQLAPNGMADPAAANEIKQVVGERGAWLSQAGRRGVDEDADAKERVANEFYRQLRGDIETQSGQPANVKAINKQIGEILPITRAVIRRIPIEARQNVISLPSMVALSHGGPSGAGLFILNQLLKSGQFANATQGALVPTAGAVGRVTGIGTAMTSPPPQPPMAVSHTPTQGPPVPPGMGQ